MRLLIYILLMILTTSELLPNNIQLSFKQRRRFDQIHLEVWAKGDLSLNNIQKARFSFIYDTTYLQATDDFKNSTDSLLADINVDDPIADITSDFHNRNGYTAGLIEFDSNKVYLTINKTSQSFDGAAFFDKGRGSFIGSIPFDIKDSATINDFTGIAWNNDSTYVTDTEDNDLTSEISAINSNPISIIGVDILFPIEDGTLIDRDFNYEFLTGSYKNKGFPVYFERTVDPSKHYTPGESAPSVDNNVAYKLSYIDEDENETELGRFVESDVSGSKISNNTLYITGEIGNPKTLSSFVTTSLKGGMIDDNNYQLPVRILIEYDEVYPLRLENLKLKLTRLEGQFGTILPDWEETENYDIANGPFVMSRLFFLQLNGQDEYLKSIDNISNSTQLTVEAWINLNIIRSGSSSPAIVASSAGEEAAPILGSKEGAWMLYLKDGKYPAFRVREIEGRGNKGYLGEVSAPYPIKAVPKDQITEHNFSRNWNYISATVHNNEIKLYVNGELVDNFVNDSAIDARMLTTIHPVWIGVNPNDTIDGNDYLPAAVKGVRVWRLALSEEEIRENAAKVLDPTNINDFEGIRRGLQLYYKLQGDQKDYASEEEFQHSDENLMYISKSGRSKPSYRPDYPHIKLTSPYGREGFLNTDKAKYQLRWISYEVGDLSRSNSRDVQFEYSIDNGKKWTLAKDTLGRILGDSRSQDTENTTVFWKPYENDDFDANLRNITPFTKTVKMKISGTAYFDQEDIFYISDDFLVAPYFSLKKSQDSKIYIPGSLGMNFTANANMIEAWVKPYRFPTEEEGSFPIIEKIDTGNSKIHYSLKLLPQGNLRFSVADNSGEIHSVDSDPTKPLVRPNSIVLDTAWTHIAVYFSKNYNDSSLVLFMIDGNPQLEDNYIYALGGSFETNYANNYPTYLASVSKNIANEAAGFEGEIKEIRFWNGSPNNITDIDTLIKFVQGAQSIRGNELDSVYRQNLYAVFSFNGGVYHHNRTLTSSNKSFYNASFYDSDPAFHPVKPYIKLVEPSFKQKVENDNTALKIRWVGFDYTGDYFPIGGKSSPPFLEFSLLGGGGNQTQPYQYVGSTYWGGNKIQSLDIPDSSRYIFKGTGKEIFYSALLDVSNTDPDVNNDGAYNDQGPLSATLTNARLRLHSRYQIFNAIQNISSEGPLFSVIPSTNFTVRILPEGYHNGIGTGDTITQLGQTFDEGGIRIYLYENNGGAPGKLIDSSDSFLGYSNQSPFNLNQNNNRFANIDFVFPDVQDGEYWLVVNHRNHLPVMSRFPVPFKYSGDDKNTWHIESGWDFTSWNGVTGNILPSMSITPWVGRYYTAFGYSDSKENESNFERTALTFNNGKAGDTLFAIASMVGGDVNGDNIINTNDITILRSHEGTTNYISDITGDGFINSDDREIAYRNIGKYSSLKELGIPIISKSENHTNYKKKNTFQAFYDINLLTETEFNENNVKLHIYLENLGDNFKLGNSTFAFTYDTTALKFSKMEFSEDIPWDDSTYGYNPVRTSPNNINGMITGLRTVEIDFDKSSGKDGVSVSSGENYIATLVFSVQNEDVINFNWHPSTSVHTTNNQILNDKIELEDIEPVFQYNFTITEPNGGEEYRPGVPLEILWECDNNPTIFLEYSSNSGLSWSKVVSDTLYADSLHYNWTAPSVTSSNYFIRAIDVKSGLEIDRSDKAFKIIEGFAQIIRPSSADAIYKGSDNVQIVWTSQGYSKIRFEYSTNGGNTWNSVSGTYNASTGSANWRVPKETTKDAVVRMIDILTGEEAARSSKFRILNGELEFQLPRDNQTIFIDRYTKIRWYAKDVDYVDFDISIDGGSTWNNLFDNVKGSTQSINWFVEESETEKAVIRAIWNGDEEMEYDRTGYFTILLFSSVKYDKNNEYVLFPNPATEYINLKSDKIISEISICDISGITLKQNRINDYQILLNISDLKAGVYILKIRMNNEIIIKKFIKV